MEEIWDQMTLMSYTYGGLNYFLFFFLLENTEKRPYRWDG